MCSFLSGELEGSALRLLSTTMPGPYGGLGARPLLFLLPDSHSPSPRCSMDDDHPPLQFHLSLSLSLVALELRVRGPVNPGFFFW